MLCTYDIYVYGWMYYWALCLSTSLKLISVLSKKAWQSNLCIIIPIWESPRGPDTKKYGSCAKILSGSWYMSFPGFWYKLFGVLLQNHRGAATKPPGCCYKNHRGPMPGVSGIQPLVVPGVPARVEVNLLYRVGHSWRGTLQRGQPQIYLNKMCHWSTF